MRQLPIVLIFLCSILHLHAQKDSSKLQASGIDPDTDTSKLHFVLAINDTASQYLENTTSWFTDDSGRLALVIHRFGKNLGSVSGHRVSINYYHFNDEVVYKIVFVTTNLGKEEISRRTIKLNSNRKPKELSKKANNHYRQKGEYYIKMFKNHRTKNS